MMQLWFAPTSPFARKALICAHELGLADQLQLIEVDPWTDGRLRQLNPLSKVPTLVLASGEVVIESGVICEYFDAMAERPRLFPTASSAKWRALGMQGLADGAAAAAGRLFAEERREPHLQSQAMMARFKLAIDGGLDGLESRGVDAALGTIGDIAAIVLLDYLEFRWPGGDWRKGRPNLSQALAIAKHRLSMTATEHRPLSVSP